MKQFLYSISLAFLGLISACSVVTELDPPPVNHEPVDQVKELSRMAHVFATNLVNAENLRSLAYQQLADEQEEKAFGQAGEVDAMLNFSFHQEKYSSLFFSTSTGKGFEFHTFIRQMLQEHEEQVIAHVPFSKEVDWAKDWYVGWPEEVEGGIRGYRMTKAGLQEAIISEALARTHPVFVFQAYPVGGVIAPQNTPPTRLTIEEKDLQHPSLPKTEEVEWAFFDIRYLYSTFENLSWVNPNVDVRIISDYMKPISNAPYWSRANRVDPSTTIKIHRDDIGELLYEPEISLAGSYEPQDFSAFPYLWIDVYEYDWYAAKKSIYFALPNGTINANFLHQVRTYKGIGLFYSGNSLSTLIHNNLGATAYYRVTNSNIQFYIIAR